jgi:hypothetical protein
MGAELFFRSLDPNFIFTWLTTKEDFIAYVSCERFKFSTVFLLVNFCVRKGKGLINPVSCVNMYTAILKWVTLEFLCYRGEVVKILIGPPVISFG